MATPQKIQNKSQKNTGTTGLSALEIASSPAWQSGRRLTLKFAGAEVPVLQKISFKSKTGGHAVIWDQDDPKTPQFDWSQALKVFSLFLLKYKSWAAVGQTEIFYFQGRCRGSLAATLGDAIHGDGRLRELFLEKKVSGKLEPSIKIAFPSVLGQNAHGNDPDKKDRRIVASPNYLPPDCVEIFWDEWGSLPLTVIADFALLEKRIRESAHITEEPVTPTGKGSVPPNAAPPTSPEPEPPQEELPPDPLPPQKPPKSKPEPEPGLDEDEEEESEPPTQEWMPPEFVPPPIDRKLFSVSLTNERWPDDLPLVSFGESLDWTLRNAFEGVLILGATGSGKTSGSGATMAEAFLRAGFGGLILTVKTDEAEHWRKLCAHCGREKDLVVVRPGGDWRLNLLAYEAQRPGAGGGLAKNLVAFCRNLLAIATRSQGQGVNEQFWQSATDQLLNATFDLFLMAGGEITFDRLANFVAAAPTPKENETLPASEAAWLRIPVFGEVLKKAKENAASAEDLRVFKRTTDYWRKIYPGLSSKTRTSITLGVFAMLDTFRGRDIPDLISSDTNLTPESIMSGKIVVLDLPIKEFGQTGLLIQSAWKYLFQMALERQAKAGDPSRRPVFLWEDEGQHFFSNHDHHFQATARSARVCRVILSQNLHNFYMEFGGAGGAAANSVFGNLNTKIFHTNSDPMTNEWAAKHFGQEIHHRVSISHNPPPPPSPSNNIGEGLWAAFNPPSTTGVSTTEQWEYAVRPEEFNLLRNGGSKNDFQVDAYITWLGAGDNGDQHFTHTTFNQNPNL